MRLDGRKPDQLRPLTLIPGFISSADGSVLIQCGQTLSLIHISDFALAAKREAERMKADIAQALEQAGKPMITECAK